MSGRPATGAGGGKVGGGDGYPGGGATVQPAARISDRNSAIDGGDVRDMMRRMLAPDVRAAACPPSPFVARGRYQLMIIPPLVT